MNTSEVFLRHTCPGQWKPSVPIDYCLLETYVVAICSFRYQKCQRVFCTSVHLSDYFSIYASFHPAVKHYHNSLIILYIYIDGLVQDCSNSIANTLQLLQSCTKPSLKWMLHAVVLSLNNAIIFPYFQRQQTPCSSPVSYGMSSKCDICSSFAMGNLYAKWCHGWPYHNEANWTTLFQKLQW